MARVEVRASARDEPAVVRAAGVDADENTAENTVRVVVAQSQPQTATTSHVTARDMGAVPRRNAEDALRLVPGFVLVQHGSEGKGHQFFLRGFDAMHGSDLELTVEGIPVNEWSNIHAQGYIDLGFVIPETIESVEVTKGPYTLGQGAFAMAGSADYQLGIQENDRGTRGAYTIGTTNRHRGLFTYSPRLGDGEDFVALEALHDQGFGENRDISRGALLGQVRLFDAPELGTFSILGSAYMARFGLPGTLRHEDVEASRGAFYDSYDPAGRGFSGRSVLAFSYRWRSTRQAVTSSVYGGYRRLALLENYTGFLYDPVHGDRRRQFQSGWTFGAKVRHDLRLTESLGLQTGFGVRGAVIDQKQDHVDQNGAPLEMERALDGTQSLTYALAGLRWQPLDALWLAAGARVDVAQAAVRDGLDSDRKSAETLWALSPRLTSEWRVVPPWSLFFAYGRGFRPPEARSLTSFEPEETGFDDDLYTGGAPTMTVADSLESGTRWQPNRYFGLGLAGFATWIERETVFDHVSGVNLELNRTRRLGVEIDVQSNPLKWLSLSADVTYVDARFVDSGNPIPLAPWLLGGARAIVTHRSGLRAGLRFIGLAPRPLPHGARGSPMIVLDATFGHTWRWIRLDVEIENVLNRRNREGEYHYASHWRPGEPPSQVPVVHFVAAPPLNARFTLSVAF